MHDGWMFGMGWSWLVLLVLVGGAIWFAVRVGTRGGSRLDPPTREKSAEEVLRERFARGEIDEQEYRARREALREQG